MFWSDGCEGNSRFFYVFLFIVVLFIIFCCISHVSLRESLLGGTEEGEKATISGLVFGSDEVIANEKASGDRSLLFTSKDVYFNMDVVQA